MEGSTASGTAAGQRPIELPDLPLGTLETICSNISLQERVALASCCHGLWSRQDVASSSLLWGDVALCRRPGQPLSPAGNESLANWLQRHKLAVRRLQLEGPFPGVQALLASLEGEPLTQLILGRHNANSADGGEAALSPLSGLRGLRRLVLTDSYLREVPHAVAQLGRALEHLSLRRCTYLGLGCGNSGNNSTVLAPLQHLSGLTMLDLSLCTLYRVPAVLSALTRLQELNLAGNGLSGDNSLQGLGLPASLTQLDLSDNGFCQVPASLAALPRLADLSLSHNHGLGHGGQREALEALSCLTALTRLDVMGCHRLGGSGDLLQSLLPPQAHVEWGRS